MPLIPPPDYSKPILAAVIGGALAFFVLLVTRNTLPHTGDNLHSLPHGGSYCDGTKRIHYRGPHRSGVPELPGKTWAFLLVCCILLYLHLSCLRPRRFHSCVLCSHP
nr:triple gene block protein 2 [Lily virus X]